jgi:hypothetical protein
MRQMDNLRSALRAANAYRAAAETALAERLAAAPVDREQRAAHGFAWVATTVAALEAVLGWCESGQDSNPLDAKIATLAFAEGIGQLVGGLPMGQNEIFRPADLGLGAAAQGLAGASADLLDVDHAATRADVAAALADGHWPSETLHDADLDSIRDQYRRFTDAEIIPHAHGWHLANDADPRCDSAGDGRSRHLRRLHSRGFRRAWPVEARDVHRHRGIVARLDRRWVARHSVGDCRRADRDGRHRAAKGAVVAKDRERRDFADRGVHRTRCRIGSRLAPDARAAGR